MLLTFSHMRDALISHSTFSTDVYFQRSHVYACCVVSPTLRVEVGRFSSAPLGNIAACQEAPGWRTSFRVPKKKIGDHILEVRTRSRSSKGGAF